MNEPRFIGTLPLPVFWPSCAQSSILQAIVCTVMGQTAMECMQTRTVAQCSCSVYQDQFITRVVNCFALTNWCTGPAGVTIILISFVSIHSFPCCSVELHPSHCHYVDCTYYHACVHVSVSEQGVKSAGAAWQPIFFPSAAAVSSSNAVEKEVLTAGVIIVSATCRHLRLYICEFLSPFPSPIFFFFLHYICILKLNDSLCWLGSPTGPFFGLLFVLSEHILKYFVTLCKNCIFKSAHCSVCVCPQVIAAGRTFAFC